MLKGFEASPKYFDAVSPFLYPVSQIIAELPEYATIIKRPIDLNHIKERLADGHYDDVAQVNSEIRLMTSNAMKFNPPGHAVHQAAQQLIQLWDEKWRTCPPKQETRDTSEDPLVEDYDMESEEEESESHSLVNEDVLTYSAPLLKKLLAEKLDIERRIAEEKSSVARKRSAKGSKVKPRGSKGGAPRKQSVTKASPGLNGNGRPKKPRKSKEMAYMEDDDEMNSEEMGAAITLTQKQELAEKIQVAEEDVIKKAVEIIKQTQTLGSVSPVFALVLYVADHDVRMRRSNSTSMLCRRVLYISCTRSSAAEVANLGDPRVRQRWVRGRFLAAEERAELRGNTSTSKKRRIGSDKWKHSCSHSRGVACHHIREKRRTALRRKRATRSRGVGTLSGDYVGDTEGKEKIGKTPTCQCIIIRVRILE